jgi:osmotically-inducible protein OsmY
MRSLPQLELDAQLQAAVLAAIGADDSLSSAELGVGVREGVVSLTGNVDSLMKRTRAARVAEAVPGVRAIANDIAVRLSFDQRRMDFDIARDALSALEADVDVPDKTIKPYVQQAWIWLVGEAETESQRCAAERAVRDIDGIRGVRNVVRVKARPA